MNALLSRVVGALRAFGIAGGLLSGCSLHHAPRMTHEEFDRVRQSRVALAVVAPSKLISLKEVVPPLALGGMDQFYFNGYSFDTLWDPSPRLESALLSAAEEQTGLKPRLLKELLPAAAWAEWLHSEEFASLASRTSEGVPDYLVHLSEIPAALPGSDPMDYLLLATVEVGVLNRIVGPSSSQNLELRVQLRLVRTSDAWTVWSNLRLVRYPLTNVRQVRDLGKDDFLLLNTPYANAVSRLCEPAGGLFEGLKVP